jgi:hypothetical protein
MTTTSKHGFAIALFETFGQAEHAMRQLNEFGVDAADCHCFQRGEASGPSEMDIAAELERAGVPEDQKSIYQYEFDAGRLLLAVHSQAHVDEVETILNQAGAINVNIREHAHAAGEEHAYPFAETEHTTPNKPR